MSVMRFWYNYYGLKPVVTPARGEPSNERQGALIKIQWPDGLVGYGDLFPWTEFGDRPLNEHLYDVTKGRLSMLMEQTIWLARRDAVARIEKRHLLRGVPRVKNSFLIQDVTKFDEALLGDVKRLGYASVKIKCGRDLNREYALIDRMTRQMGFLVRLDFGTKLDFPQFKEFAESIPEALRERIEYVEDPFPFEPRTWLEANKLLPIAVDFEWRNINFSELKGVLPFKVVIIKPARLDIPKTLEVINRWGLRMVITSSLDHPVGIMHAVAVAGEVKKSYPNMLLDCGCFSHIEYQPNEFSAELPKKGPIISEIPGTGVGFDELLEKVTWVELRP